MKTKLFLLFSAIVFSMSLHAQSTGTIEFVDNPTEIVAGSEVSFRVAYTKSSDVTSATAYVKFLTPGPDSEAIPGADGYSSPITTQDSGEVYVNVTAPATEGVGFIIQVFLFDSSATPWPPALDFEEKVGITITEAPPAPNYIKILDAPTEVVAGSEFDITVEYKKDYATQGLAYVRFRNNTLEIFDSGTLYLDDNFGTKVVTVKIPDDAEPGTGNGYNFQSLIFPNDGSWSASAYEDIGGIIVLADPNTVAMVDAPNKLITGISTDIDVTYTKDPIITSATVKLLLLDDSDEIVDENSTTVTSDSGTVTLSIESPAILATGYSLVAELIEETTVKANVTKGGISIEEPSPYFLAMVDPPTVVDPDTTVDIVVNYTKDDGPAFINIQFKGGDNTAPVVLFPVPDNEGSHTFTVQTPTTPGEDYSIEAKLFTGNTVHKSQIVEGVIVDAPNVMTLVDPVFTVTSGTTIDVTFDYTKSSLLDPVYAYVRLRGPKEDDNSVIGNLTDVSMVLPANSGTETLSLPIAGYAEGTGYSYQLQMFNAEWANIYNLDIPDVIVEAYVPTGENSLEIVDISKDPINNGDTRKVSIQYNLLEESIIYVELLDAEEPSSEAKKIGEGMVTLYPGNGTLDIDLVVNKGNPNAKNRVQAMLFKADWSGSISIGDLPYEILDGGDGTITYIGQDNDGLSEYLGDGYYSNYYIAEGWAGPLKMNFGPVGSPSWIEYTNENSSSDSHQEFDIKIQKFSWHQYKDTSVDRGYPRAIDDIEFPINTSMNGQWSDGSGGKGQINMTAWVTEDGEMEGNRTDIIVHAFDNGGNFRQKYDDNTTVGDHTFNNIGEFTATNGLTYQILRTLPGYLGEVASYNLVPDSIVQEDPTADYPTETFTSEIDMKDIIDNLIAKEAAYEGAKSGINSTWQINGLEWTVVGQSQSTVDGVAIANGHGKFTFNSYRIPDITDVGLSTNEIDIEFGGLTIYPNPFKDSFTFKTGTELSDSVSVELFTIDGRKIATIDNSSFTTNGGTVDTSNLSKGLYLVRITSGNAQVTKKMMKY